MAGIPESGLIIVTADENDDYELAVYPEATVDDVPLTVEALQILPDGTVFIKNMGFSGWEEVERKFTSLEEDDE